MNAPFVRLAIFPILLVDNVRDAELTADMHRSALLIEPSDPRRQAHDSSPAWNGTAAGLSAWVGAGPLAPAAAEVLTGSQASLLAVVPVNGGAFRLAIVGYLLPAAGDDGDARADTSARPDGAPASAPSARRAPADGLVVDTAGYRVLVGGHDAGLVLREFQLLAFLAANPGRAFPREHLLARVWGDAYQGTTRTVDVHIHRLRRKLGPFYADRLVTVRRVGYMYHPAR